MLVQNMDLDLLIGFAEPQPVSISLVLPGQLVRILDTEWMCAHLGAAAAGRDQLQGRQSFQRAHVLHDTCFFLHFTLCLFSSLQLHPSRPKKRKKNIIYLTAHLLNHAVLLIFLISVPFKDDDYDYYFSRGTISTIVSPVWIFSIF